MRLHAECLLLSETESLHTRMDRVTWNESKKELCLCSVVCVTAIHAMYSSLRVLILVFASRPLRPASDPTLFY